MGNGLVGTGPTGTGDEAMQAHLKECGALQPDLSMPGVSWRREAYLWVEESSLERGVHCPSLLSHRRASRPFLRVPNAVSRHLSSRVSRDGEVLTMSWKKNQACCRTSSRTALPLTTHCRASSSCSSCGQDQGHQEPRATPPTHSSGRHHWGRGGCSPKPGWGSEQQEAMQGGMRVDPVPAGLWMWGEALDPFPLGQWDRHQISHPAVPSTFCTVCLG